MEAIVSSANVLILCIHLVTKPKEAKQQQQHQQKSEATENHWLE